jgi:hypothetical protein
MQHCKSLTNVMLKKKFIRKKESGKRRWENGKSH